MIYKLAGLDYFFIFIYFVAILWLGLSKRKNKSPGNDVDYLLGGRQLTTPLFVFTLVSTWYGGILGVGEFTYLYGISNWLVFAFPYYIFAFIFAVFFAEKLYNKKVISIPELIGNHYGKHAGLAAAFFVFIIISPAPYLLIISILLSYILPGSTLQWALASAVFSILYLRKKGFRTVILTDILQFILMFAAFIILLFTLLKTYPIINTLSTSLPENHLSPSGGLPFLSILTWFFIALWTLIDPGFHQRISAAKSVQSAKKGILWSIVFWFIFDGLTLLTALYARALLPALENPLHAYPALAVKILPIGLTGLFFTGLIATVMSTLDSYFFLSVQTLSYDIFKDNFKKMTDSFSTNLAYLLTALTALLLLFFIPSVINLWFTIGSLIIPALLIPVLLALNDVKMPEKYFIWTSIPSFLSSFLWQILKASDSLPFFSSLEAFYPGMFCSILISSYFYFRKKELPN